MTQFTGRFSTKTKLTQMSESGFRQVLISCIHVTEHAPTFINTVSPPTTPFDQTTFVFSAPAEISKSAMY